MTTLDKGPIFRYVMDRQMDLMLLYPHKDAHEIGLLLKDEFETYV